MEKFETQDENSARYEVHRGCRSIQYTGAETADGMAEEVIEQDLGVRRASSSDLDQSEDTPILGSAQTPWGSPARHDIRPDTLISIGGMQTTVEVAEKLGLVEKVDGQYQELLQDPAETPADKPKVDPEGDQQEKPPVETNLKPTGKAEVDEMISTLANALPEPDMMDGIANAVISGQFGESDLAALSQMTGTDQGQLATFMDQIYSSYQNQASAYIASRTSIPASQLFEWGAENINDESLQEVARLLVFENNTNGLDALLEAYLNANLKYTK